MAPTLPCVLEQISDVSLLLRYLKLTDSKNLSLTCRMLNELCFQSCKRIKVCMSQCIDIVASDIAAIPRRFSSCQSVQVSDFDDRLFTTGVWLLPALASMLPKLHTMEMYTGFRHMHRAPGEVALLLELVRLQLTGLTHLVLKGYECWAADNMLWQVLGRLTNLPSLDVALHSYGSADLCLSALQNLNSTLHSLAITVHYLPPGNQDYSFIGSLTSLTHLQLSLASTKGLSTISLCTKLRHLHLDAAVQRVQVGLPWGEDVCRALASLTSLTELRLLETGDVRGSVGIVPALKCLKNLETLWVGLLDKHALPVLAGLTKLTKLGSYRWRSDPGETLNPMFSLGSIKALECSGPVPMQAFKQLQYLKVLDTWPASQFLDVGQNCKCLEELDLKTDSVLQTTSMPQDTSIAQRTAALCSLARLKHLTALHFAPLGDADLAVLPKFTGLLSLDLRVYGDCSPMGLMHVCSLPQLHDLELDLPGVDGISVSEASNLISGLQRVRKLTLRLTISSGPAFFEAFRNIAREGMPKPADSTMLSCY